MPAASNHQKQSDPDKPIFESPFQPGMGTSEEGTDYQLRDDAGTISPPRRFPSDGNDNRTGTTLPEGCIEERVQVDRRKLEQMIVGKTDTLSPLLLRRCIP